MKFFVTAARGTERALAEELRELGLDRLRPCDGGVTLSGRFEDAWRVCLESRIAVRVLWNISEFPCASAQDLYEGVRAIAWSEHVSPETTLAVSAVGAAPGLDNTMFVAQRTKDAIVDGIRAEYGQRPSVDRDDPDVAVFVRLARGRATVSLDLAGESLHRRGYREPGARAPLKETLAAALLRMSGWDRKSPLVDPMCGSGTLCIEADLWARGVAPGASRARFGFERWRSFDPSRQRRLALLRERAQAGQSSVGACVIGRDDDPRAIELARRNAERAGAHVDFSVADVRSHELADAPVTVIVNPPYGERMQASRELFERLAEALARLPRGARAGVLLGPASPFVIPDRARRMSVRNGRLECTFVCWTL